MQPTAIVTFVQQPGFSTTQAPGAGECVRIRSGSDDSPLLAVSRGCVLGVAEGVLQLADLVTQSYQLVLDFLSSSATASIAWSWAVASSVVLRRGPFKVFLRASSASR